MTMKLAYYCLDDTGCAYYRSILPFSTIEKKEGIPILSVRKGAKPEEIAATFAADAIQMARIAPDKELRGYMAEMKRRGVKVVLEYDDNVFAVSPYSPHYAQYGAEEFTDDTTGIKVWQDGKGGFSIDENLRRLENVQRACEMADMVTVTQPHLAEVFSDYNKNIACLPNYIDPSLWQKLPLKRKNPEEVRLFWAGGCSHYVDWLHLVEPLRVVMAKYPHVKLVVMGQAFKATLAKLPQDRVEFHPWVHFDAYPLKVSILDPDIALIPLDDNEFNRCKSNIKWVEMSAMGIPSVVSAVSPYFEYYNGGNMVAVENDEANWIQALSEAIENPLLRAKIGGAAQRTVLDMFDINHGYKKWLEAYTGITQ